MDYRGIFEDAVDTLRAEKRYRVFADIERIAGNFPRAIYRDQSDNQREITIWCSNDYLGMGQHPKVIAAMQETAGKLGVDQIDLLILHQALPSAFDATLEAYRALETLLADGKVLVAGGFDSSGTALASAELYDPAAGTFSRPGISHCSSRLSGGTCALTSAFTTSARIAFSVSVMSLASSSSLRCW